MKSPEGATTSASGAARCLHLPLSTSPERATSSESYLSQYIFKIIP